MSRPDATAATHQLIVNDQEQFAVWPATRRVLDGWRPVGRTGTRESLTEYLREILVETLPAPQRGRTGTGARAQTVRPLR